MIQNNDESTEFEKTEESDVALENDKPLFEAKDIDIATEQNSLSTIIAMIEDEAIDMNTEFQRSGNLWDKTKMSRLIESILFRLPLPAFYFDASNDNRWLVIDGLQRLSTFKSFIIDNDLTLTGLLILKEPEGKNYKRPLAKVNYKAN